MDINGFATEKGTDAEVEGRQRLAEMEDGIVGDRVPAAEDNGAADGSTGGGTSGTEFVEDEESAEIVAPKVARDPMQPTANQRALHDVLHIPFREWCAECVQGRGKDRYHLRIADESGVPRVAMDYMFISERGITTNSSTADEWSKNGECIAVLVLKSFLHKSVWAYLVEAKGVLKSDWLVKQIVCDLDTCGFQKCTIIVKTDQESSIIDVQNGIAAQRKDDGADGTVIENSKVGDSSSNARVERAIQELGGMARTYRLGVRKKRPVAPR